MNFMMIGRTLLLMTLLGFEEIACQTQCQCDGNVLNVGGWLEWFYTFDQLFYDPCLDPHTCQETCLVYLKNITNDFDLDARIDVPSAGDLTLGEFACSKLVHDVPANSSLLFQSQSCASAWFDVATAPGFCCINGHFSPTDCAAQL